MPSDPLWDRCLNQLRLQTTRSTWETYLRNTTATRDDGRLIVHLAGPNAVAWCDKRLRPIVERTITAVSGEPLSVEFDANHPEETPCPLST